METLDHRILVFGNAGSGKTTMAKWLSATHGIPHLDLDTIAWEEGMVRRPMEASVAALEAFCRCHRGWVVEGCYGSLIEAALPWCSELRFLNPGVPACVRHCRARPWEPHKYESLESQERMLGPLLDWVANYETRDDECSLEQHRALFDAFSGKKREYTAPWDVREEAGG